MSIEQRTQRTVTAFEFRDLGVDHGQYFPGVSTVYTDWDAVFVGAGETAREAVEDALEGFYQGSDAVVDFPLLDDMRAQKNEADDTISAHDLCTSKDGHTEDCLADTSLGAGDNCDCHDECELHHYCALYVRYAED